MMYHESERERQMKEEEKMAEDQMNNEQKKVESDEDGKDSCNLYQSEKGYSEAGDCIGGSERELGNRRRCPRREVAQAGEYARL